MDADGDDREDHGDAVETVTEGELRLRGDLERPGLDFGAIHPTAALLDDATQASIDD